MLPYRNLWEGRDLCGRVYAPRGLILRAGPHRVPANRPVRLPSVRPSRSSGPGYPREPAPRRAGTGGPGDRKELCIKTLYVRDRLCQQPLSCVRNASRRARCWASTHSRCNTRGPEATRQGGCCRIIPPVWRPARRHHAATSIVISRGSVAGPISTSTGAPECAIRNPLPRRRGAARSRARRHHIIRPERLAFRYDATDRSKGEGGSMLTERRVNYARLILLIIT